MDPSPFGFGKESLLRSDCLMDFIGLILEAASFRLLRDDDLWILLHSSDLGHRQDVHGCKPHAFEKMFFFFFFLYRILRIKKILINRCMFSSLQLKWSEVAFRRHWNWTHNLFPLYLLVKLAHMSAVRFVKWILKRITWNHIYTPADIELSL